MEDRTDRGRTRSSWEYVVAAAVGLAVFAIVFWPPDEPSGPAVAAPQEAGGFAQQIDEGLAALDRGDNDAAIRSFSVAIEANRESPVGYLDLGIALLRAGRYLEAVPVCEKAVELAPDNLDARHNLGFANRMIGRHALAVEILEAVTRDDPSRAVTWYELGMAYRAIGAVDKARASFERTLAIAPGHGAAGQQLAELGAPPAQS
jgi:tetratricopeptide (TPR) repeat protein